MPQHCHLSNVQFLKIYNMTHMQCNSINYFKNYIILLGNVLLEEKVEGCLWVRICRMLYPSLTTQQNQSRSAFSDFHFKKQEKITMTWY